jgi:hypothetical protein
MFQVITEYTDGDVVIEAKNENCRVLFQNWPAVLAQRVRRRESC